MPYQSPYTYKSTVTWLGGSVKKTLAWSFVAAMALPAVLLLGAIKWWVPAQAGEHLQIDALVSIYLLVMVFYILFALIYLVQHRRLMRRIEWVAMNTYPKLPDTILSSLSNIKTWWWSQMRKNKMTFFAYYIRYSLACVAAGFFVVGGTIGGAAGLPYYGSVFIAALLIYLFEVILFLAKYEWFYSKSNPDILEGK